MFLLCGRLESEIVEEIAMDVLEKLNRVYVGDLDKEIDKYQQLAKHRKQYYDATPRPSHLRSYEEATEHVRKLQLKRHERLLRLPLEMYSHTNDSDTSNDFHKM